MKRFWFVLLAGLMIASCATRFRDADPARSSAEVEGFLRSTIATSNGTDSNSSRITALLDDPATAVYYAEGPGEMGPLYAVAAFYNLQFFSNPMNYNDVAAMKIYYLDRMTDRGHDGALIFEVTTRAGQKSTEIFINDGSNGLQPGFIEEGEFVINLKGSRGQIIEFYSDDIPFDVDEMASVIQGRISGVETATGEIVEYGKISSMVGFF